MYWLWHVAVSTGWYISYCQRANHYHYRNRCAHRDEAMAEAYLSGAYTVVEIGTFFGVHYMTVSRAVRNSRRNAEADVGLLELTPHPCPGTHLNLDHRGDHDHATQ